MGVNSLPKTVTRQRRDFDLIPVSTRTKRYFLLYNTVLTTTSLYYSMSQ